MPLDESLDDRFVEACQMECHIEHLCDVFIFGSTEQRTGRPSASFGTAAGFKQLQEYTE